MMDMDILSKLTAFGKRTKKKSLWDVYQATFFEGHLNENEAL